MPSAIERTVPTSARSALPVSMPSMRWRRIDEISSGLMSICSVSPLSKWFLVAGAFSGCLCDLSTQLVQAVADAAVQHPITDLEHQAADDRVVYPARQLDRLPRLLLDLGAD